MVRFAVALILFTACSSGVRSPSGPLEAAQNVAGALRDDDPRTGWKLLAEAARDRMTYDDFAARWRAARGERQQRAAAIERTARAGEQTGTRGDLVLADGPRVQMVRERAGWRLDTPLVARTNAASPNEALRLFARAVDDRSVADVLRLLTAARREDVRRALERFASGLRAHVGDALDVSGDRATLSWHDGEHRYRVTLKRESGEWRIDDFNAD